jgi:hypothetical protein
VRVKGFLNLGALLVIERRAQDGAAVPLELRRHRVGIERPQQSEDRRIARLHHRADALDEVVRNAVGVFPVLGIDCTSGGAERPAGDFAPAGSAPMPTSASIADDDDIPF